MVKGVARFTTFSWWIQAHLLLSEPGESLVLSATFLFGELFAPATPE